MGFCFRDMKLIRADFIISHLFLFFPHKLSIEFFVKDIARVGKTKKAQYHPMR